MLTMTCLWEYEAATFEDRTHYWRRVASEGDCNGKLRAWINQQPEDIPLVKLVTLAVDALADKQLTMYQWLTDYYMDTCPSRRNQMTYKEAKQCWENYRLNPGMEQDWGKIDTARNLMERARLWQYDIQMEIGYRAQRETWHYFIEQDLYWSPYADHNPQDIDPVSVHVMIGLCKKKGHSAWLQEIVQGGFRNLDFCCILADNVDVLHTWYQGHGREWKDVQYEHMIGLGSMQCLKYYLAHGGVLKRNCIYMALAAPKESCDALIPFLIDQGATWDVELTGIALPKLKPENRHWLARLGTINTSNH
jgi:hypothetical protein